MKANKTPLAVVALVAAVAFLSGCEKKTTTVTDVPAASTSTTTSTTTVAPSQAASNAMDATASAIDKAGDAAGDALITGKVKSLLLADTDVKGLQIDVDTHNGIVSLNGTADTAGHSDKATTIAKGVDGVKSVDNKLTVKP